MLVRIRGLDVVRQLGEAGVWVEDYWYLVKRCVAVQPKRKIWKESAGVILASLKGLGDRMGKLEGMVVGVGKGVWRKAKKKDVVKEDERVDKELRRKEGDDEKEEENRRKKGKELSVLAKPFVFEPKGKKMDFGGGPLSTRGDMIFGWS